MSAPTPALRPQRGVGMIAVIMVLVALAALSAAIVQLGRSAQTTQTQDLLSSRASLAAQAGVEWGLYQAFKGI